jgi:hypothetical protein
MDDEVIQGLDDQGIVEKPVTENTSCSLQIAKPILILGLLKNIPDQLGKLAPYSRSI